MTKLSDQLALHSLVSEILSRLHATNPEFSSVQVYEEFSDYVKEVREQGLFNLDEVFDLMQDRIKLTAEGENIDLPQIKPDTHLQTLTYRIISECIIRWVEG